MLRILILLIPFFLCGCSTAGWNAFGKALDETAQEVKKYYEKQNEEYRKQTEQYQRQQQAYPPNPYNKQDVPSAWLGLNVTEEPTLGMGVLVAEVWKNSPAFKMGIREGDIVNSVSCMGRTKYINSIEDLVSFIKLLKPGDKVRLGITRNQRPLFVSGVLEKRTTEETATKRTFPREGKGSGGTYFSKGTSSSVSGIKISAESQTQLIPVFVKSIKEGNPFKIPHPHLVKWHITNNTSSIARASLKVEILERGPPEIKQVCLNPGEREDVGMTPFGSKLWENYTSKPAGLLLEAKIDGKTIFQETRNIQIRAAHDIIWSFRKPFDAAYLIAYWVTPNDPVVAEAITKAKSTLRFFSLSQSSFSGYQAGDPRNQIRAIFWTLIHRFKYRMSYVNNPPNYTAGHSQAVRFPRECLQERSANCIEGAVLMASLFERIGLEPFIVVVPGHAFVGVRKASGSRRAYYIETVLFGRSVLKSLSEFKTTFEAALQEGERKYNSYLRRGEVQIIDIKKARKMGITEMAQQ